MAKKKPDLSSAEVLKTREADLPLSLITDYEGVPFVPPEVLRDWLNNYYETFENAITDLHQRIDEIANGTEPEIAQAQEIFFNGLNFLDIADKASPILQDDQPPEIGIAFTHGLRLGLLFERLLSLSDGRFKDRWRRDFNIKDSVEKRKAGAADRKREAEEAIERMQKKYPDSGIDFQKEQAAEELGITKQGLNKRLRSG